MEIDTRHLSPINGKNSENRDHTENTEDINTIKPADRSMPTETQSRTSAPANPDASRDPMSEIFESNAKSLPVLVNRFHPSAESAADTESRLAPVNSRPGIQALDPGIRLDRICLEQLDALLEAVSGKDGIVVVSGYRDLAEQTEIYADSLQENGPEYTAKFVALPGCSEHHTGLAVDVGSAAGGLDFIAPEFPDDGVCGAFKSKAAKFGFVQRYKAHKEHLTGISCEPWHFRYVGAAHAEKMEELDLCLEEYVEWLRQTDGSAGQADGFVGKEEARHGN